MSEYGSCAPSQTLQAFQVVNNGTSPVTLSDITIKFWVDDTSVQPLVGAVNYGGTYGPSYTAVSGVAMATAPFLPACGPDANHQANWEITVSNTSSGILGPGMGWTSLQTALHLASWGSFSPGSAFWYSPCSVGGGYSYTNDPHYAIYVQGNLVTASGGAPPSCRAAGCTPTSTNTPTLTATATPSPTPTASCCPDGSLWAQVTPVSGSSAFPAMAAFGAVVFNNNMWAIGGSTVVSSPDGIHWTTATSSAAFPARSGLTSVVFTDPSDGQLKMWVIGGSASSSANLNDVWCSTNGSTWAQKTATTAFSARSKHTSVVFTDPADGIAKMWVIGGQASGGLLNDVWCSADGVNWTQKTASAAFSPRYGHTSVVFTDPSDGKLKMWVLGGNTGISGSTGCVDDVWCSMDGVNWAQKTAAAAFPPRYIHTSIAFCGKLWVMDGWGVPNAENAPILYGDTWTSPDGVNWTQASASGQGGSGGVGSLVFGNTPWTLGGVSPFLGLSNGVWQALCGSATATPSPTATATNTPVATASTMLTSTLTATPTQTPTITSTNTANRTATPMPSPTACGISSLNLQLEEYGSCGPNQTFQNFQVTNNGTAPVNLSDITVKFWVDDTSGQALVGAVNYGGSLIPGYTSVSGVAMTTVTFSPACGPGSSHQANWEITVSDTGTGVLGPGMSWSGIQTALHPAGYSNFSPGTAFWYSPCSVGGGYSYTNDPHYAIYVQGNLVAASGGVPPSCRPVPTCAPGNSSAPSSKAGGASEASLSGLEATATPTAIPSSTQALGRGGQPSWVALPNVSKNGEPIRFRVSLGQAAPIRLALYDLTGSAFYETSVQGQAGENTVTWNLQNRAGRKVASGLYVYTLIVDGAQGAQTKTGKVVVLR